MTSPPPLLRRWRNRSVMLYAYTSLIFEIIRASVHHLSIRQLSKNYPCRIRALSVHGSLLHCLGV